MTPRYSPATSISIITAASVALWIVIAFVVGVMAL